MLSPDPRPRQSGRGAYSAILVLTLVPALYGCAAFEGPQVSANEHTICYTRLAASLAQLRTLATQACNGTAPHFLRESMDLSACPVLVPERAYFTCSA